MTSQQPLEASTVLSFLHDVVLEIKERMVEADGVGGEFEAGRAMAFQEVIEHLRNQGEVFGLPLEEIALSDTLPAPPSHRRL